MREMRIIECAQCGQKVTTLSARKKFCDSCGIARRLTSVARYNDRAKRRLADNQPEVARTIAGRVAEERASLISAFGNRPNLGWAIYLATPFSLNASKNRRWSNTGKGTVFLSAGVRAYQDALIIHIRNALGSRQVKHTKIWISLFVQKPDHRSDAINVIDTICDAIKKAINVDDRWFSLDQVDWEVTKTDPQIFIKIGQEDNKDRLVCSHCGQILEIEAFSKNKGGPFGRSRSCLECSRTIDAARRLRKK